MSETGFAAKHQEMEVLLEDTWGVKDRTARGYATIVMCAKWIYDHYEGHFLCRGFTWNNFLQSFVVDKWAPAVKLAHVELTKADVICHDFAMAAVKLMSSLSLAEVHIYKSCLDKNWFGFRERGAWHLLSPSACLSLQAVVLCWQSESLTRDLLS